jgi:hypothetical protein
MNDRQETRTMPRVKALWAQVAVATLLAGLVVAGRGALAQDEEGTAPAAAPTAASPAAAPTEDDEVVASGAGLPELDAGSYAVRLRDLETRINALKEQIFRSKARLSLLAETVLGTVTAGAMAVIVHENRMSSSYRLVKAAYALDGARIFNKADEEGTLGDQTQFDVFNGSIVPGEHSLTTNLEYRGHGFGIFSYLKGYRFRVRSSHTFSAPEGRRVTVRVVGYEKGGPTAPLEERPDVRYVVEDEEIGRRTDEASADEGSAGAPAEGE